MSAPELCHVFMFVEPGAPEAEALERLGLRESYRRDHPGQGTTNVCYCFDNAFLELLWVTDRAAIVSPVVARTGLSERADWRENGANPFGIALRGAPAAPFPTWDYKPPYLPAGMSIPVACSSDDSAQPLLFMSPGNARPDQWQDGRAGNRQLTGGLSEIAKLELTLADGVPLSDDLQALVNMEILELGKENAGSEPRLVLTVTRSDGGPDRRLELPAMKWLEA
ncbi:VOC family protein [Denitrobaculum tricleocarpae]|uniref:VOC family protein n=1 Tax=Denitrobaculum tricleocarpae TaxID=2591009 RepID=A0A545TTX0_9PROT|nr:VOC family protein [Denitrobaculum tricleocarpae]TQV80668.1 VOC family protein [Denitrobaculum tricleocarpae]